MKISIRRHRTYSRSLGLQPPEPVLWSGDLTVLPRPGDGLEIGEYSLTVAHINWYFYGADPTVEIECAG